MDNNQPYNAYQQLFDTVYLPSVEYEQFNLVMTDDQLKKMILSNLDEDIAYWNQRPWSLQDTDKQNTSFMLGYQDKGNKFTQSNETKFQDNRLFSSMRAILSYATGQLAVPEITPSRSDEIFLKGARNIQMAMYQHAKNNKVDIKVRSATMNLITRKRGILKLRWDPNKGAYGDIVTEVCNPEDIIVDRFATFLSNPNKIYHRIRCSVDELIAKFPDKADQIRACYGIKKGVYTQMSKYITYFECWFTYIDANAKPAEGVCWFLPEYQLILDKMPNPNWVYTGDNKKDKQENILELPPKPFVWFNYMNTGHSFIDETCLFEQAKPLQDMLNHRGQQLNQNIDFMNGRWIASKKAFGQEDAQRFVNKGARTVAMVDAEDVGKALQVMTPNSLPSEVFNSVVDFRNEIDEMMGTPSQFKGSTPGSQNTATRDLMQKQQAGMLQDDLVRGVASGMEDYYKILAQMMRVNYTDDYWFQVKGADGKFDFVILNGDSLDKNVKISVQVDSTLPLDKQQVRATAMQLWQAGHSIDYLTLMQDLGLPNPEVRTERYLRSQIDLYTYMESVEEGMDNNDAEVDIQLLERGKTPDERDNYDANYLNYFNDYMSKNRFARQPQNIKQKLLQWLMAVQHIAVQSSNLQGTAMNDAGIVNKPPIFPLPKRTENIRLIGNMDPQQTQQIAQNEGQMFTPVSQAENAQNPGPSQGVAPPPGQAPSGPAPGSPPAPMPGK